jgi:hypothetical protein
VVEIVLVPVEDWHIAFVAEHMRAVDRKECEVLGGMTGKEALQQSVQAPGRHWCALFGGEPVAIFGVSTGTLMGGDIGTAWLLGTDRLRTDWRAFARASRSVMNEILRHHSAVSNVLLTENRLCMRWLAWLGASFRIHEPFARFLICA